MNGHPTTLLSLLYLFEFFVISYLDFEGWFSGLIVSVLDYCLPFIAHLTKQIYQLKRFWVGVLDRFSISFVENLGMSHKENLL